MPRFANSDAQPLRPEVLDVGTHVGAMGQMIETLLGTKQGLTILLVEDNDEGRPVRSGLAARNGTCRDTRGQRHEALEMLEQRHAAIDHVNPDIVMPKISTFPNEKVPTQGLRGTFKNCQRLILAESVSASVELPPSSSGLNSPSPHPFLQ